MKTPLSRDNPFADAVHELHWAYGLEFIPDGVKLLDYGCFDGAFLRALQKARNVTAIGADKNLDVIASQKDLEIVPVEEEIPFPSGSFDVVTLFDVLEHVYDERSLLAEIRRVLRDDGLLIVSVPRRNIFSFMDWGNYKYLFPAIHRWWYVRRHGRSAYDYRYVNNPYGLIGDVEKEKAWHQHFRRRDLVTLLRESGFAIRDLDGAGLFTALLVNLGFLRLRFPISIWRWQAKKFDRERLFCVAVKKAMTATDPDDSAADRLHRQGRQARRDQMSGQHRATPNDSVAPMDLDPDAQIPGEVGDLIGEFFGPGIREAEELAFLPRLLVGCDYFIDVGANIGQYTVVANQYLVGAEMLAIEANPRLKPVIERLVAKAMSEHPNGNKLTVETAAILDDSTPTPFFVAPGLTTSSLFEAPASEEIVVQGRRLDEFYRRARKVVIKMDIEGAEYRALLSGRKFLRSGNTELFLELHGWGDRAIRKYPLQVLHLLIKRGYAARKIGSHYHFFRADLVHRVFSYARVAPLLYSKWLVHRFAPALVPAARRLREAIR